MKSSLALHHEPILLDRDGVINHDSDDYILSPEAWQPIAGSIEAIADLTKAGLGVFVITNQSALNRGYFALDRLEAIHHKMCSLVKVQGGKIQDIFYCPHRPDEHCACRKPGIGLIRQLTSKYPEYTLENAFFVGDSYKDIEAARKTKCKPILVRTGKGKLTEARHHADLKDVPVFDNLAQATKQCILPNISQ